MNLALDPIGSAAGPDIWVVGDAGIDMEIAHRTGCVPILLHRDDQDADEFADWPPEFVFNSCNNITELVARW